MIEFRSCNFLLEKKQASHAQSRFGHWRHRARYRVNTCIAIRTPVVALSTAFTRGGSGFGRRCVGWLRWVGVVPLGPPDPAGGGCRPPPPPALASTMKGGVLDPDSRRQRSLRDEKTFINLNIKLVNIYTI